VSKGKSFSSVSLETLYLPKHHAALDDDDDDDENNVLSIYQKCKTPEHRRRAQSEPNQPAFWNDQEERKTRKCRNSVRSIFAKSDVWQTVSRPLWHLRQHDTQQYIQFGGRRRRRRSRVQQLRRLHRQLIRLELHR
jgi:hypothetical protein